MLMLDGIETPVLAFCAFADDRQEAAGVYRLEALLSDGRVGCWWAHVSGVQSYDHLRPIDCGAPGMSLLAPCAVRA